ncbi:MAG: hypothetical protein RIF41_29555 [Polyangiaceae bacterium]
MSDPGDLLDDDLAEAVEACRLPAAHFRHPQHVHLGWHYLRTQPLLDAIIHFGRVVARFAAHHGAPGKYDAMLTVAYMLLIEERRRLRPDADWPAFASENDDLIRDGQAALRRRLDRIDQRSNTRDALPERNSASASSSSSSSAI